MRVSLNWLKEYVDISMSPTELGDRLTMSGLEVEAIEPVGQGLQDVVAAKILSVTGHPKADRLSICHVDTGSGEASVVCGAPNAKPGMMAPMALPGTRLPGGMTIEETVIRGERSVGMLLAEDEMGLTEDHTGIMALPDTLMPGAKVPDALHLEDHALEISLTPNRPDCASVMGIAREIAAFTGQTLRRPEINLKEEEKPVEDFAKVTIEDPIGCPRYAAGMVLGVELKTSPFWMRYRLHVSGVRSISNVVDVSNYVLLEMGQPLHAFDYDRLQENRIVVKRARAGEVFTTLDGQTHTLDAENLMICDGQRSVALAGIMGGLNSEIFAGSKNVLIESAFFDPITIRRGSKKLGLSTEASYRFERGVDIEGAATALRRSMMLISRLAGGTVPKGVIDAYPRPHRRPKISLRVDKTNEFLGTSLSSETMASYIENLEMEVQGNDENIITVVPPALRVDITREVDLMEEIARMEGYDSIPVTSPPIRPSDEKDAPELDINQRVAGIMVGLGFTEIITYPFISPDFADILGAAADSDLRSFVELRNPLSVEQSVMRTSLIPGLLTTVKGNAAHGEENLKLFEWGKVFIGTDQAELPEEKTCLAAIMTGSSAKKAWYSDERDIDFFDIKGAVETLLEALGIRGVYFQRQEASPGYDSDIYAAIFKSGFKLGDVGRVSEDILEKMDIRTTSAFMFELELESIFKQILEDMRFEAFARFPAVFRDISIIVGKDVQSAAIEETINENGKQLVDSVLLFDLYEGKGIDPSERALTFRICYRSKDRTLDGKEINRLHEAIIEGIRKKTGGKLREG